MGKGFPSGSSGSSADQEAGGVSAPLDGSLQVGWEVHLLDAAEAPVARVPVHDTKGIKKGKNRKGRKEETELKPRDAHLSSPVPPTCVPSPLWEILADESAECSGRVLT